LGTIKNNKLNIDIGDYMLNIFRKKKQETPVEIDLIEKIDETIYNLLESTQRPDEDFVWKPLDYNLSKKDLTLSQLREERIKARDMFNISPEIAQFLSILNSGTFGNGLEKPNSEDIQVQNIIDLIWEDTHNQKILFNPLSMKQMNTCLVLQGEIFFVLTTAPNIKMVKISTIDPDEITNIIFNSQDASEPMAYERKYREKIYDMSAKQFKYSDYKTKYYMDYEQTRKIQGTETNQYIYHIKVNTIGNRGIPEISRCYHWVRAHARSVQDMATLSKALAMFAWRKKITTKSSAAINSAVNRINTATPSTGAIHLANDAVSMDTIPVPTGGIQNLGDAARQTFLEAIRSLGFGEHYYSQADTGNLATASAMELPAIWKIEDRQMIWKSIIINILNFAIRRQMIEDYEIEIEFPPAKRLNANETNSIITSIIAAYQAQLIDKVDAVKKIYEVYGLNFEPDLNILLNQGEEPENALGSNSNN